MIIHDFQVMTRDGVFRTLSTLSEGDNSSIELRKGMLVLLKPNVFDCVELAVSEEADYGPVSAPWVAQVLIPPTDGSGEFTAQWFKSSLRSWRQLPYAIFMG